MTVDKGMQEFENFRWPVGVGAKTHIAILTALTFVIGIYFIGTAVLIAQDGVLYIEIAKKISDNTINLIHGTEGQAPGYPVFIYLMHKAIGLFYDAQSLQGWIISAQAVSLLSKLIATGALYFVGSYFVGSRFSFWGVLILSVLPDSIEFGSDVLTDWSGIVFLAVGFLLLLLGVHGRKHWIFGFAGITAGLGYLVRSECGQVVLYGTVWLLFNLLRPQGKMKRTNAAGALFLLIAGFAVVAFPYMWSIGYVFPEQLIWKFSALLRMNNDVMNPAMCLAGLSIGRIIGNEMLITNVSETLLYYYSPALLIGLYCYFRNQWITVEKKYFASAFVVVNVAMALWLSSYMGFLSKRHTFPLVAFTVVYISFGIYVIACWLGGKAIDNSAVMKKYIRVRFFVLIAIGISICAVKMVKMTPLRWDKQSYRDTAKWLISNTTPADIIAVPDKRIAFYAERQWVEYDEKMVEQENIFGQVNYIVKIVGNEDEKLGTGKETKEEYSTRMNSKKGGKLVTYKVIR
jgi:hypothetical protein